MDDATAVLVTVTGRDRPGLTSALTRVLHELDAHILDMEQVVIRDQLLLGLLVDLGGEPAELQAAFDEEATRLGMTVVCEPMAARRPHSAGLRHYVTVLGQPLTAGALSRLAGTVTECGGNIERIVRLSRYPITSFELLVSGGEPEELRTRLTTEAAANRVDVGIQPATLYRRAKRLVVLDVDSTLVQGEVVDVLAAEAGCGDEVARITQRAMAGELDFATSLRRRVALLEGLPLATVERVADALPLMPGARTLVRTLKRLGFVLTAVSGGFTVVTDGLARRLGLDASAANELEIVDGRVTGRLLGDVVDRAGKARLLERFAREAGVPLTQTVAVGDGANDLDMLNRAGLGIAFNAKPVVRQAADTAVSVPYLDAILFLLGITREEIEAADAEDAAHGAPTALTVTE